MINSSGHSISVFLGLHSGWELSTFNPTSLSNASQPSSSSQTTSGLLTSPSTQHSGPGPRNALRRCGQPRTRLICGAAESPRCYSTPQNQTVCSRPGCTDTPVLGPFVSGGQHHLSHLYITSLLLMANVFWGIIS